MTENGSVYGVYQVRCFLV